MSNSPLVAASILSADFARLGEEVQAIDRAGSDWIHVDVMDGNFVPNLTFGAPIIKAIRPYSKKPFDVHLMIYPVRELLDSFIDAGADRITFHTHAIDDPMPILTYLRDKGVGAGLAFSPKVPFEVSEGMLDYVDLLLIMTVEPGFGGQSFMSDCLVKVSKARTLCGARPIHLQVDGGITAKTAPLAIEAGANVLVAGSAVFNGGESLYAQNIATLKAFNLVSF